LNSVNAHTTQEAVQSLATFFERLQPGDLSRLNELYASDAHFKDPFNEVQGIAAIEGIFVHMFKNLHEPHFIVTDRVVQERQCFLSWEFRFRFKRFNATQWHTVRGGTHVVFNDAGLVQLHRDYWDAAEELYEKFPLVGPLMRWLKRRVNH